MVIINIREKLRCGSVFYRGSTIHSFETHGFYHMFGSLINQPPSAVPQQATHCILTSPRLAMK